MKSLVRVSMAMVLALVLSSQASSQEPTQPQEDSRTDAIAQAITAHHQGEEAESTNDDADDAKSDADAERAAAVIRGATEEELDMVDICYDTAVAYISYADQEMISGLNDFITGTRTWKAALTVWQIPNFVAAALLYDFAYGDYIKAEQHYSAACISYFDAELEFQNAYDGYSNLPESCE